MDVRREPTRSDIRPMGTDGIVFGTAPPIHSPWLASSFVEVTTWEMYGEKWTAKWRATYPGAESSYLAKLVWVEGICSERNVTDVTRTHFPDRLLRRILFSAAPPEVDVELVVAPELATSLATAADKPLVDLLYFTERADAGGDARMPYGLNKPVVQLASTSAKRSDAASDMVATLLRTAKLPPGCAVRQPGEGALCARLGLCVGHCVHARRGDRAVVTLELHGVGVAPTGHAAVRDDAVRRGYDVEYVLLGGEAVWIGEGAEYRRVRRHLADGADEAEPVRRALAAGYADARVARVKMACAEMRHAEEAAKARRAAVALAVAQCARHNLPEGAELLKFALPILNDAHLGIPGATDSAVGSRATLAAWAATCRDALRGMEGDPRTFTGEDAFRRSVVQSASSASAAAAMGSVGRKRVTPSGTPSPAKKKRTSPGGRPLGKAPKDSNGTPMTWNASVGMWESVNIPGDLRLPGWSTARS